MRYKQEIILKFEKLVDEEINNLDKIVDEEINNLDKIVDEHEKFCRLDTLYKIHKYLYNFDELEPVLNKFFEEKKRKNKWKER